MPCVTLIDPWGVAYRIDTRRDDTLRAWFAEVLPHVNRMAGIPRHPEAARIIVLPTALPGNGPDWLTDTRVIGNMHAFPHRDGVTGLEGLAMLRAVLAAELDRLNAASQRH